MLAFNRFISPFWVHLSKSPCSNILPEFVLFLWLPQKLHENTLMGPSLSSMTITVIEKVNGDEDFRKQREIHIIRKFNTFFRGLKRQP